MFTTFRFIYIDRDTRNKFEVFARDVSFADTLIERINALGVFNLRRARRKFCKELDIDVPPYELEVQQLSTVEEWENKKDIIYTTTDKII